MARSAAPRRGERSPESAEGYEALKDEQIKKLKQKIGDLVLDNDILREAMKGRPFDPTKPDE